MSYFSGQNETNKGRDIKAPVLTKMKSQRLILKMSRGGQFDALPMVFPKLHFLEKGLSPAFLLLILSSDTIFLNISLKFLTSFGTYEEFLHQY